MPGPARFQRRGDPANNGFRDGHRLPNVLWEGRKAIQSYATFEPGVIRVNPQRRSNLRVFMRRDVAESTFGRCLGTLVNRQHNRCSPPLAHGSRPKFLRG
jgi:hypothetical protein